MFKKLKASLGIGSTKVDTILEEESLFQGESIHGVVHIFGGDVEQQVDAICVKLNTEMKVENDGSISYQTFTLEQITAVEPFVIAPNEERKVDFTLALNDETPITRLNTKNNKCHVWVETTLDIDFALDPKDRDFIEIKPLPVIEKIIAGVEGKGFSIKKADVEKGILKGNGFRSHSGCYQEIEFVSSGFISKKEIELSFVLDGNKIHCLAEIDRTFGGGDKYTSFSLNKNASESDISRAISKIMSV